MLGLAVCRLLPSRGERGLLLGCSMQAPHCGGFSCGAWALGDYSLVAACRLLTAVASPVARGLGDYSLVAARRLLIAVASPVEHGLSGSGRIGFSSCCTRGSEVVVRGLGCPEACEILVPRPGIQPLSPAFEGRFLTTDRQGHPCMHYFMNCLYRRNCWICIDYQLIA